jgi:hypothetical protein
MSLKLQALEVVKKKVMLPLMKVMLAKRPVWKQAVLLVLTSSLTGSLTILSPAGLDFPM